MSQQDDDDLAHWRDTTRDVQPLEQRDKVPRTSNNIKLDLKRIRERDERAVMHEALFAEVEPEDWNTGDETEFRRDGIANSVIRKLRRGQFAVQGTLDLHGLKRQQAHQATTEFLRTSHLNNWRCIKIIHGKGLRSPQGLPVLKTRVQLTLQRTDQVLAYCSAPAWEGGHGAVLVLLRRTP